MSRYKLIMPNGKIEIHDDMDGTATHLLPVGCVSITNEEAAELMSPSQADINAQRKSEILVELTAIDSKSIRPIREGDAVRVEELDGQAQALRDEFRTL